MIQPGLRIIVRVGAVAQDRARIPDHRRRPPRQEADIAGDGAHRSGMRARFLGYCTDTNYDPKPGWIMS